MSDLRDSSGRLTFEFGRIDAGMYSQITKSVVSQFNLEALGQEIVGPDVVFQDFRRGEDVVGLEWDNWSGYIVNAKAESAEPLVREIASYVSVIYNS
ncbi:MAG: hypothetical protein IPG64_25470 [Haliea sp.]|nr:hypothetical protein [Haliea sp.]